jgi:hypothetical protein
MKQINESFPNLTEEEKNNQNYLFI